MGETIVSINVHGPNGSVEVEALADTGATFTKIPRGTADGIGLETAYETDVMLGDGRTVARRLGWAEIEIDGVRRPVLIAVGGNGERALVGYTTLESLGFKVNTVTHLLEPTPAIEY